MKPRICANPKCSRTYEPNVVWQAYCKNGCRVTTFLRAKRAEQKKLREEAAK